MNVFRTLFRLYIHGSIHVAFAVLSLLLMTLHIFQLPFDAPIAAYVFFGTIGGYNFVKYEDYFRSKKHITTELKVITAISIVALLLSGWAFLLLARITQITCIVFFVLTLLYTVPLFPRRKNMRNWTGIKIYMVALCWAGITVLLPLQNAGMPVVLVDVALKCAQRFIFVIILILIFEIIDSKEDDPLLMTVPQKIGIKYTQWLNIGLLLLFYILTFFKTAISTKELVINFVLVVVTALFTVFATPNRSKYYTLFWVESIPIFWLLLVLLASAY
ncbi:hypothetical protein [Flavobacterium litorale]|uniref:Prenyltransferase n=1 Tax=Flavobacterium litorale TaxID=2856519 RepID=A0ABX8V6N0_9FLAO|nr:hypothetical protein [Flavobacterium litorale]QYJ68504.1 hypothetical protein K1I41_01065 [Flavobacterium litorale]